MSTPEHTAEQVEEARKWAENLVTQWKRFGLADEIIPKLEALLSALDKGRRDGERLDWLGASTFRYVEGDQWENGSNYWRCQDRRNINTIDCLGKDVRGAIDCAIKRAPKPFAPTTI